MTDLAMVVLIIAVVVLWVVGANRYRRSDEGRAAATLDRLAGQRVLLAVTPADHDDAAHLPEVPARWSGLLRGVDHVDGERRLVVDDLDGPGSEHADVRERGVPLAWIRGVSTADGQHVELP